MKSQTGFFARPVFYFSMVIFCGFIIITGRLAYLQVWASLSLLYRSKHNYLRYSTIPSLRGTIVDHHHRPLATNRPVINLVWCGTGSKKLNPSQEHTLDAIAHLLNITIRKETIVYHERRRTSCVIMQNISFEKLSILVEQFPEHDNIRFETAFQRYYPYAELACHVLGYLNIMPSHQRGVMGLEKACDRTLQGIQGQQLTTINSYGQQLGIQNVQQALAGDNIVTTLDIDLQRIAEEAFPGEAKGVLLVMEASTGALRVVLSRPGFDPNVFTESISKTDWQKLLTEQAFLNRAFFACYPPASLFKLVTMTAALDTRLINPDESWYCPGYTVFYGRPYACMNRKAHRLVTIEDAIIKSCNIPFYDIARRIKINTLAAYAQLLGLGFGTKSVIGEKIGLIPTTQWKQAVIGEPWMPGETLSASIGQTFMLIPPIQACRMIGTICEGYSVNPYLIEGTPIERIIPSIRPQVLKQVKDSMRWVVVRGTGQALKNLDMIVYAKTGTAQTRNMSRDNPLISEKSSHGWFAAHVTCQDEPSLVVVILLEQVHSSGETVQVAKKFLKMYQKIVQKKSGPIQNA